ncbi:BGTF surface domain-containing protein [Halorarius halobius]|uniref:BGTF surface domain-containing protein n=1 Tax=Halorarius halobius TaxID=2962671 RepID=UPI0020CBF8EB|nr:BGTF surface domain-containing protein [Halorarius halobius]
MNRRLLPVVALAAVVGLGAVVGVYGLIPSQAGADGGPASPTATPVPGSDAPVQFAAGPNEQSTLETAPGQTIGGETALDPGTNLTVRLKNSGASPFLFTAETTVSEDGTWSVAFDLSSIEGDGDMQVAVYRGDELLANTTAGYESTGPAPDDSTDDSADAGEDTDGGESDDTDDGPYGRFVTVDGEEIQVRAASEQVVRGETSLEPGTTVTVRLRSAGSDHPFLLSEDATVAEDGTFRATFNLSETDAGQTFDAAAIHDGETLARSNGTITEAPSETASLEYEGDAVTLRSATGQTVSGTTSLDAGQHVAVRMHGSGESPFLKSQSATVTDDGTFSVAYNMSGVDEGSQFRVVVVHDGERLTYAPGEVAAA